MSLFGEQISHKEGTQAFDTWRNIMDCLLKKFSYLSVSENSHTQKYWWKECYCSVIIIGIIIHYYYCYQYLCTKSLLTFPNRLMNVCLSYQAQLFCIERAQSLSWQYGIVFVDKYIIMLMGPISKLAV